MEKLVGDSYSRALLSASSARDGGLASQLGDSVTRSAQVGRDDLVAALANFRGEMARLAGENRPGTLVSDDSKSNGSREGPAAGTALPKVARARREQPRPALKGLEQKRKRAAARHDATKVADIGAADTKHKTPAEGQREPTGERPMLRILPALGSLADLDKESAVDAEGRLGSELPGDADPRIEAGPKSYSQLVVESSVLGRPDAPSTDRRLGSRDEGSTERAPSIGVAWSDRLVASEPPSLVGQSMLLQSRLLESIAEDIQAATTVIGGWVELFDRGLLTETEVPTACARIRVAQRRIDDAGERIRRVMVG